MYYYAADFRYNESMANMYGVSVDRYLLTMNNSREALYASAQESALKDIVVQIP